MYIQNLKKHVVSLGILISSCNSLKRNSRYMQEEQKVDKLIVDKHLNTIVKSGEEEEKSDVGDNNNLDIVNFSTKRNIERDDILSLAIKLEDFEKVTNIIKWIKMENLVTEFAEREYGVYDARKFRFIPLLHFMACNLNNAEILEYVFNNLLNKDKNKLNEKCTEGLSTPLHWAACKKGNVSIIKKLIELGANPNIGSNKDEHSPLMVTIIKQVYKPQLLDDKRLINLEAFKFLLNHHLVDIFYKDKKNCSVLDYINNLKVDPSNKKHSKEKEAALKEYFKVFKKKVSNNDLKELLCDKNELKSLENELNEKNKKYQEYKKEIMENKKEIMEKIRVLSSEASNFSFCAMIFCILGLILNFLYFCYR